MTLYGCIVFERDFLLTWHPTLSVCVTPAGQKSGQTIAFSVQANVYFLLSCLPHAIHPLPLSYTGLSQSPQSTPPRLETRSLPCYLSLFLTTPHETCPLVSLVSVTSWMHPESSACVCLHCCVLSSTGSLLTATLQSLGYTVA